MKNGFTAREYYLILASLNESHNNASKKLQHPEKLGDIEKSLLATYKEESYELICKIEKITDTL